MNRIKAYGIFFIVIIISCFNVAFSQTSIQDSATLVNHIFATDNKVNSENRTTGTLDPSQLNSLPIGLVKEIGITRYVICVDSARFKSNTASLTAYAAIDVPGTGQKLAFAAKNIGFNPQGIYTNFNSKLLLASNHTIAIGPNVNMVLKPDGFNYVEWDCNGFKAIHLKGYFEFSGSILVPDKEVTSDSTVKATFEIHTNDIHDFVTQVSITPFCIKGLKDMAFSVTDAVVDLSELVNAPNMSFPNGYTLSNTSSPQHWTGFYMKQFKIKLPKELSKNGQRVELYATNFVIDQTGVSGLFQATNVFGTPENTMNGWPFSVNHLGINIVHNHLNGGTLGGTIILPLNEITSLDYTASVFQNTTTEELDYQFILSPKNNLQADLLAAQLNIYPSSFIVVTKQNGKFKPEATLNGNITFTHSNFIASKIDYEQVVLSSEAPYLKNGIFNVIGDTTSSNKAGGFNISISNISIVVNQNNPSIFVQAGLNFMSDNTNSLGVSAGIQIITKLTPELNNGTTTNRWQFDRVKLNDIGINIQTQAFLLSGLIKFKENDPVYGNGFFGSIAFSIPNILPSPATSNVWFGRTNTYRYFYIDASIPYTVPLGNGLSIYRFSGGVYYHMRQPNNGNHLSSSLYTPQFGQAADYIPDNATALGVKAGVTIGTSGSPKPFNGDVLLELAFSNSGGIQSTSLTGDVFFMSDITERLSKPVNQLPVHATMFMQYDNTNQAFHATVNATIHLPNINGSGQAVLHFDPTTWYVHIGRPSNRIAISIANIGNTGSYFMVGNTIESIPPVPYEVQTVFGGNVAIADQRNTQQLQTAQGICLGSALYAGVNKEVGFDFFKIYGQFSVVLGMDAMLAHYNDNQHCSGSSGKVGFNGWYTQSQVYAAMQGSVGVKGDVEVLGVSTDFDITVLSGSVAAVLQAQMPNPVYIEGQVACNYNILGVVSGNFDFDVQAGSKCQIVSN